MIKPKTFYSGIDCRSRKADDLDSPALSIFLQGVIEGMTNEQEKEKQKQTSQIR